MDGEWLSRAQVQERFGAAETTVRQWCAWGWLEERPVPPVAPGLCWCGCGKPAPIATRGWASRGWANGKPLRFIRGHNGRHSTRTAVSTASVERLEALHAARAAVDDAFHQVAVLAPAGDPVALLEATAELRQRKAEVTILEAEVLGG